MDTPSGESTLSRSENGSTLKGQHLLPFFPFRVDSISELPSCAGCKQEVKKVVSLVKIRHLPSVSSPLNVVTTHILQTQGIQVIVVGVGRYIRTYEIYNMAYDQYHAFHIASYDNLTTLEPEIKAKACGGKTNRRLRQGRVEVRHTRD